MERWKLIKRLVDAKLEKNDNVSICVNFSDYTKDKLEEYFELEYEPFGYIKFENRFNGK